MTPTLLDHLLAFLLILPMPLVGAWQFRRLKARLAAGEREARLRQYREIMVEELVLSGAVLGLWLGLERPLSTLPPEAPDAAWWPWVGWGLALTASGLLVVQTVIVVRSGEGLAQAREQLANVSEFLPRTEAEVRTFWVLSVAAGVCEEVVFRGFAMVWVAAVLAGALGLVGTAGAWGAALGSSVIFGLAHSYQGPLGMVKTGTVGLVLAVLAMATGGLLAPMIVHTVMDVTSGLVAHRSLDAQVSAVAG